MKMRLKIHTSFVSPITLQTFLDRDRLPIFIIRSIGSSDVIGKYEGTAINKPILSPSPTLYREKRDGKIEIAEFERRYAIEMSTVDLQAVLKDIEYLASLANTDQVVLLGYGADDSKCHRSVLARILDASGLLEHKVTELIL